MTTPLRGFNRSKGNVSKVFDEIADTSLDTVYSTSTRRALLARTPSTTTKGFIKSAREVVGCITDRFIEEVKVWTEECKEESKKARAEAFELSAKRREEEEYFMSDYEKDKRSGLFKDVDTNRK